MTHPLFQSAHALALSDVNQIMQNQFAIVPGVSANNQSVAEPDAACVFCNDAQSSRGQSQFFIFRQRNAIDHQNANARNFVNSGLPRVGYVSRPERYAPGENKLLLHLCPLIGKRKQMFECFLIDHGQQGLPRSNSTSRAQPSALANNFAARLRSSDATLQSSLGADCFGMEFFPIADRRADRHVTGVRRFVAIHILFAGTPGT
jgi:hypothetical protein